MNNNFKILIVAAGRRYSLVERLKYEGFDVSSYELEPNAPISKICNVHYARNYNEQFNEINEILISDNIPYVLPKNETCKSRNVFSITSI